VPCKDLCMIYVCDVDMQWVFLFLEYSNVLFYQHPGFSLTSPLFIFKAMFNVRTKLHKVK